MLHRRSRDRCQPMTMAARLGVRTMSHHTIKCTRTALRRAECLERRGREGPQTGPSLLACWQPPILQRRCAAGLPHFQEEIPLVATACTAADLPGEPAPGADTDPPGGGAQPSLGAGPAAGRWLSDWRAPGPPAAHRRRGRAPSHLGSAPHRQSGSGGLLDLALDDEGWVYLSYSEPGDGGAGTAVARARLQKTPSSTGNCCFASSPRWPAAPTSGPVWC